MDLQTFVVDMTRRFPGELGLYVEDVRSGERYSYNADTPMYLASGIKIVVMMALYQAILDGEASLDETLIYRPSDVRDGAPLINYLRSGTPIQLGVLLEAMIQTSDNAATDMVIRRLGIEAVNDILKQEKVEGFGPVTSLLEVRNLVYRRLDRRAEVLTYRDIFKLAHLRSVEKRVRLFETLIGIPPNTYHASDYDQAFDRYYREGWNSASMRSMGTLLSRIVRGEVISKEVSERMLTVMRGTRTGTRRFRAGLPDDVPMAHKTGTQHRRTCDFAIVFLPPDDRPIIVVASINGGRRGEAERLLARIAAASYSALLSHAAVSPTLSAH